jgi:hypothetical protein
MEGRDGQVFRRLEPRLVEIPRLTGTQWRLLGDLELVGCRALEGRGWRVGRARARVLRELIRMRLIEVMGVQPAVYRVTRLGRVARSLGVRR